MSQKTILTFHGIGDPPRPVQESERSVWISKPQFEAVLDAIFDKTSGDPSSRKRRQRALEKLRAFWRERYG